jgi:hypothetical protein
MRGNTISPRYTGSSERIEESNWITFQDGIDPSTSHWEDILSKIHWALKQTAIKPIEEYLNQYSHIINPMDTVVADTLDKAVNR